METKEWWQIESGELRGLRQILMRPHDGQTVTFQSVGCMVDGGVMSRQWRSWYGKRKGGLVV